jgi:hypothetical protein
MKRKLLNVFVAMIVAVGGGTFAGAAPAHASDAWGILCQINSNAWLFGRIDAYGGADYIRTIHAGRGFRYHGQIFTDYYGRNWIYGHSAEAPDTDGWALAWHIYC